jgi:hypothetical protein
VYQQDVLLGVWRIVARRGFLFHRIHHRHLSLRKHTLRARGLRAASRMLYDSVT